MEKPIKTIRVKLATWRKVNALRGYNECNSFEDVVEYLLNKEDSEKTQEDEEFESPIK